MTGRPPRSRWISAQRPTPRRGFGQNTFEVVSPRLKPDCAATAIIEGLLDLEQASESN